MRSMVDLLLYDEFGIALAERLALYDPSVRIRVVPNLETFAEMASTSRPVVLAIASEPESFKAYEVAASFARAQKQLISITRVGSELWFGPLREPPAAACWGCTASRLMPPGVPHAESSGETLMDNMLLVAAGVWYGLHLRRIGSITPGLLWCWDLKREALTQHELLGLDGCKVCGLGREWTTRGVERLRSHLSPSLTAHWTGKQFVHD